jgi:hypothetical protein
LNAGLLRRSKRQWPVISGWCNKGWRAEKREHPKCDGNSAQSLIKIIKYFIGPAGRRKLCRACRLPGEKQENEEGRKYGIKAQEDAIEAEGTVRTKAEYPPGSPV